MMGRRRGLERRQAAAVRAAPASGACCRHSRPVPPTMHTWPSLHRIHQPQESCGGARWECMGLAVQGSPQPLAPFAPAPADGPASFNDAGGDSGSLGKRGAYWGGAPLHAEAGHREEQARGRCAQSVAAARVQQKPWWRRRRTRDAAAAAPRRCRQAGHARLLTSPAHVALVPPSAEGGSGQ